MKLDSLTRLQYSKSGDSNVHSVKLEPHYSTEPRNQQRRLHDQMSALNARIVYFRSFFLNTLPLVTPNPHESDKPTKQSNDNPLRLLITENVQQCNCTSISRQPDCLLFAITGLDCSLSVNEQQQCWWFLLVNGLNDLQ